MDRDDRLMAEVAEGLRLANREIAIAYQKLSAIANNEKRRVSRQRLKKMIENLAAAHNVNCLLPMRKLPARTE